MQDYDWREGHGNIIHSFLHFLNDKTDAYILKGGTALMECYGLDRFSEESDLDSTDKETIKSVVDSFCEDNGYQYRVAKDTDTVKRFMIHYSGEGHPLKIEVSYRNREIAPSDTCIINGLAVYNIDRLAYMKCNAFSSRDKIRDLYDVTFICKNYMNDLSPTVRGVITDALANKGLEQFDYLIATQYDELINKDKLADDYLDVFDALGIISDDEWENSENILTEEDIEENEGDQIDDEPFYDPI